MEGADDSFQIDEDAMEEAEEGGDAMEEDTPAAVAAPRTPTWGPIAGSAGRLLSTATWS